MGRYEVTRIYRQGQRVNERLYDPQDDNLTLINPKVVSELNGNGAFEFEMPI